jgi:predicted transposase/invertase (TIGR01784 family)
MVITVELPKFVLEPPDLSTPLESWLYFLRNADRLDPRKLQAPLNRPQIQLALEDLEMLSQDDLERERYLARMRVLMDEESRLHSAREEGLEQGLEQGLIRILQKRFGSVDSLFVEKIRTLDFQRLVELFDTVLDFSSIDEVEKWLAERGAGS